MKGGVTRSVSPNHSGSTSGLPKPSAVTWVMPEGFRSRMVWRIGSGRVMGALISRKSLAVSWFRSSPQYRYQVQGELRNHNDTALISWLVSFDSEIRPEPDMDHANFGIGTLAP